MITELSYLVKHVEEHGKQDFSDPWSVRQMALYHKMDPRTGENVFIVLNPSRAFRRRLQKARKMTKSLIPWDVHAIMLSSVVNNWRWYIGSMEDQCSVIVGAAKQSKLHRTDFLQRTKAQLLSVEGNVEEFSSMNIQFSDTQNIQAVQDKLNSTNHFIRTNTTVMTALQRESAILFPMDTIRENLVRSQLLSSLVEELNLQFLRVETAIRRVGGTSNLVSNTEVLMARLTLHRCTTSSIFVTWQALRKIAVP